MVRGGCGLKEGAQEEMRGIGSAAPGPPGSFAGAHVIRLLCFFCTPQEVMVGSVGRMSCFLNMFQHRDRWTHIVRGTVGRKRERTTADITEHGMPGGFSQLPSRHVDVLTQRCCPSSPST